MRRATIVNRLRDFWRDEYGMLSGTDYILAVTILAIGGVAALVTVRDSIVQGFGDIANAMASLDQSYTVNYTLTNGTVVSYSYSDSSFNPARARIALIAEDPYVIELCSDVVDIGTEN